MLIFIGEKFPRTRASHSKAGGLTLSVFCQKMILRGRGLMEKLKFLRDNNTSSVTLLKRHSDEKRRKRAGFSFKKSFTNKKMKKKN